MKLTSSLLLIMLSIPVSVQSFIGDEYINAMQKRFFGNQIVSRSYQKKVNEFLYHAQIYTPPIVHQLSPNKILMKLLDLEGLLGLATITGIWLDEKKLNRMPESEQLFTIAHEAAHYILKHPLNLIIKSKLIVLSSIYFAYVCDSLDYLKFPEYCSYPKLSYLVHMSKRCSFYFVIGKYISLPLFNKAAIPLEKEADLKATQLLFECGHEQVIKDHLKYLKTLIKKGHGNWSDNRHPTIAQEYRYIKHYYKQLQTKASLQICHS